MGDAGLAIICTGNLSPWLLLEPWLVCGLAVFLQLRCLLVKARKQSPV